MKKKLLVICAVFVLIFSLAACGGKFDIKGTWKSVGDVGWGQAQPGAVIVFDGTNANLFSPMDTYAFYEDDNGDYRIDLTGLLGSNPSLGVNVIDNDNIELLSGGGVVATLQRVS